MYCSDITDKPFYTIILYLTTLNEQGSLKCNFHRYVTELESESKGIPNLVFFHSDKG